MPTIESIVKVSATHADGNADYVVEVTPDLGLKGHGFVTDTHAHSAPWSSDTGDSVKVTILGQPPFTANQVLANASVSGATHDHPNLAARKKSGHERR